MQLRLSAERPDGPQAPPAEPHPLRGGLGDPQTRHVARVYPQTTVLFMSVAGIVERFKKHNNQGCVCVCVFSWSLYFYPKAQKSRGENPVSVGTEAYEV